MGEVVPVVGAQCLAHRLAAGEVVQPAQRGDGDDGAAVAAASLVEADDGALLVVDDGPAGAA
ncbi:hypothetical protein ACWCQ0_54590, partial [Streptomyces massasporeus]